MNINGLNDMADLEPVQFQPMAYYDSDGDCIEFFVSNAPFKARRLDKWVTVYYARENEEVVGSLVKNIHELMRRFPGFDIEVEGGRVLLSHVLRASAWSEGDEVKRRVYKAVITKTEEAQLEADLQTV